MGRIPGPGGARKRRAGTPVSADACADVAKHEPAAPPWEGSAPVANTAGAAEPVQRAQPIQCTITQPTHTCRTPTAVAALAFVGSVSMLVILGLIMTLCWLALQGVHVIITGFWLALTLSKWDPTNEDQAPL